MQYNPDISPSDQLATLYGFSTGNNNRKSALMQEAKEALGITSKAKHLPDDTKRAIVEWHIGKRGVNDSGNESTPLSDERLQYPIGDTIATETEQSIVAEKPPKNWGGKREGQGRKPKGITTKTMRIDVELMPVIKRMAELKAQGVSVDALLLAIETA